MHNFFNAYWWIFLLRGLFALLLGILAICWPGVTFTTFIIFIGAYLLIAGIFAIIGAVAARKTNENWGIFLLSGIAGVILGILTFYNPFITGAALIYLAAFWAILAGLIEIIIAIRLRKVITGEGWYIAGGCLTVIFGLLLFSNPVAAAVTLTWLFGIYAVVSGVMLISLSLRLRKR
ncbi:HdeD family acid-resistance protein [Chitinophaga nivalis]|uniref:HdeD family acid-resistance protein n=1 Tax=Chitinophaga nivalis TaxID=2991709 RepID=A0ABT3IW04_9BACT|nr:HdeD family acid-resistance protein [Chitinophaga nivalis]MCW3462148.1 HdeD family acid-resistance protein [Chitinophaga nivalis]MCW3488160.1 HdeD family acid-resistance protein [Chitinophaga nivalis]